MGEVTVSHEIETDEDTFWSKIVLDEGFNKKLFETGLKFPGWKLLDSKEDDAKLTRRVQVSPPTTDLPGPMKKLIGDRFTYVEVGTFDKKTKRYSFVIEPSTLADKMKLSGEIWADKLGDKKVRRHARIKAEVKIFGLGGMIEDRVLADVKKSYEEGARFTNQLIKENGL